MPHCSDPKIWPPPVIEGPQTVTREHRRSTDSSEPDESEPSPSHRLSLRDVDPDALKVVRKLLAAGHEAYLVGGCVPIESDDPGRVRSACVVYDPRGERIARYDKVHLFAFHDGAERYDESRTIVPGDRAVAFESPWGRIALSICYDLRFPELYRSLGELTLILVPAAFTVPTGKAHWSLLLRARAVENQCYVLAAAQGGTHPNGRATWGHSMLVDPWGDVVGERATGAGFVVGEVDAGRIADVRRKLPALGHRRLAAASDVR